MENIVEVNNRTRNRQYDLLIKKVIVSCLKLFFKNKTGLVVSLAIVGDVTIRRLNKMYRRKDKSTDVLSFCGDSDFLGEIVLNLSCIKKNAIAKKRKIRDEVMFITIHGFLHLIGYTDDTDRDAIIMNKKTSDIILAADPLF